MTLVQLHSEWATESELQITSLTVIVKGGQGLLGHRIEREGGGE